MDKKRVIKRGEVYWVKLDPTEGSEIKKTRPAVVVSVDDQNQYSQVVVVVPLSTAIKKVYSFQYLLRVQDLVCKAKCEQIRAVSTNRLLNKITTLTPEEMFEIQNLLQDLLFVYEE